MGGWILFHVLQVIAYLCAIAAAAYWIATDLWPNFVLPKIKAGKQGPALRASGQTIDREEGAGEPCEVLSVDEARAGQVISNVPNYNPEATSWTADRTVVATALAHIYTPKGQNTTLFIWLSGDMLLMKTPLKWRLLSELPISTMENKKLLRERRELLDDVKAGSSSPDQMIQEFRGCQWRINGAYGLNEGGSNPGQSTIECTSMIDDHIQYANDLPKLLARADQTVHYYDLRADHAGGDPSFHERCLVAIWAAEDSDCVVYVGKDLSPAEVAQMGVL